MVFLKIIDAKSSLPVGGKSDTGFEKGFSPLDVLDSTGEHDNISIGLKLVSTNPAPPHSIFPSFCYHASACSL
jgi:hypothetical protein